MSDLERALAFGNALQERCAERVVPFRFGRAFLNDALALVWDLNVLRVETDEPPPPAELEAEAERVHADAGHAYRRVDLPPGSAPLVGALRRRGWVGERHLVMAYRRPPLRTTRIAAEPVALDDPDLRRARDEYLRTQWWGSDAEARRQLLDARGLLARATRFRQFAARAEGRVASWCELYSDGETAQIEDVVTLPAYRGRGLATAVVLAAVETALADRHRLVFLVVDADDWPKALYGALGFEELGERRFALVFTRAPAAPRRATAER